MVGNGCKTSNDILAIAKYQLRKQACFHNNERTQQ
jgi:hypothetical protein